MNYKNFLLFTLLCISSNSYPAVGCMDTSQYLQTKYDTKELHYVHCNCACDSSTILRTWGKCILCEHYHQPKNWVVLRHGKQVATVLQYRSISGTDELSLSPATQHLIHTLVSRYKKSK